MKIIEKEIIAKDLITKSNLPASDYVINPYVGCPHACKYCYARFMKRFTGHTEKWGTYKQEILQYISEKYPQYLNGYREIYNTKNMEYWKRLSADIDCYCALLYFNPKPHLKVFILKFYIVPFLFHHII